MAHPLPPRTAGVNRRALLLASVPAALLVTGPARAATAQSAGATPPCECGRGSGGAELAGAGTAGHEAAGGELRVVGWAARRG